MKRALIPQGVRRGMDRAAQLLVELAGGQAAAGVITVTSLDCKPKVVGLSPSRCNRLLGSRISKRGDDPDLEQPRIR